MRPTDLKNFLTFSIKNRLPILVKGKPGIGKSDIVFQACGPQIDEETGKVTGMDTDLIISHPVVSDPTDYKGLPFANPDGTAHFLPFGELNAILKATRPTVFFLDDLGQAPASVQAAAMQLILARRINGHIVSDQVTFIAATNRREDKAGVQGILEPVKSRFASIVELEVNTDDWINWALSNNMPIELISFIKFRPDLLEKFEPSKDIVNTPCPRTVAAVGKLQNAGLPRELEFEAFSGAAGSGFTAEYRGFLQTFRDLPTIESIVQNPDKALVPTDPAVLAAISGLLASRMNDNTANSIFRYMGRLPADVATAAVQMGAIKTPTIYNTKAFIDWSAKHANLIL